ncbi:MAG: hypothetical protein ACK5M5_06705 [Limnobaculum xujianqingii]
MSISEGQLLFPSADLPLAILPIIRQHASDAAFYWGQITNSEFSVLQNQQNILDFQYYLDANLDGLSVADEYGWQEALKSLKRWRTQGEAFVCGYLAHNSENSGYIDACWKIFKQSPQTTLNGYAAALSYLPYDAISPYITYLLSSGDADRIYVAITVCANHKHSLDIKFINACANHENAEVRSAICQYVLLSGRREFLPLIQFLVDDVDLLVKYTSTYALSWLAPYDNYTFEAVWQTIQVYLSAPLQKGLPGLNHAKRLETLVRVAGQLTSCHDRNISHYINLLPLYLQVLFFAHSGKSEYLPHLYAYLSDETVSRLAFWAIHMITGLNINDSHYLTFAANEKSDLAPINTRCSQISAGIGWPDKEVIETEYVTTSMGSSFLGEEISDSVCKKYLAKGKQVERYIAAWHLCRMDSRGGWINICSVKE